MPGYQLKMNTRGSAVYCAVHSFSAALKVIVKIAMI